MNATYFRRKIWGSPSLGVLGIPLPKSAGPRQRRWITARKSVSVGPRSGVARFPRWLMATCRPSEKPRTSDTRLPLHDVHSAPGYRRALPLLFGELRSRGARSGLPLTANQGLAGLGGHRVAIFVDWSARRIAISQYIQSWRQKATTRHPSLMHMSFTVCTMP
jgi:hypothetical protein